MKRILLATALSLGLAGCYTVKFQGIDSAYDAGGATTHIWTHSLFWGFIPLGKVNIDQCGDHGIKRMKTQVGGLGLLAYALTGGIWTPMHVKITCARPSRSLLDRGPVLDDGYLLDDGLGWDSPRLIDDTPFLLQELPE